MCRRFCSICAPDPEWYPNVVRRWARRPPAIAQCVPYRYRCRLHRAQLRLDTLRLRGPRTHSRSQKDASRFSWDSTERKISLGESEPYYSDRITWWSKMFVANDCLDNSLPGSSRCSSTLAAQAQKQSAQAQQNKPWLLAQDSPQQSRRFIPGDFPQCVARRRVQQVYKLR